ncbi:MAG TPA: class I SAM-dependent methyltransferase [Egicoccus sp.]|nr:class I SAM-dependent methyltransferase [Egicoccus sp.]HSK21695.1 class I SAM-dependent methyltransferase [Egicoccus sp.]
MSDPRLRAWLYDLRNAAEFSAVWEHEKMLADRVRVQAYERGIADHVRSSDVVLDVGTGTGLLAFFAARQGARRIYAIDHSPFIDVARQIAAHNAIAGVTFVQTHSRRFVADEPVDVIVHEQFGDDLYNEHLLDNLLDLKRRVLRPGGRILPARFELFVEPVALEADHRIPRLSEIDLPGLDLSFLEGHEVLRPFDRMPSRFLDRDAFSHLLTAPSPISSLDLDELDTAPVPARRVEQHRDVVADGVLSGFVIYFRVVFDADNVFDTAPWNPPTSWGNRFLPVGQRLVQAGDRLDYVIDMPRLADATSWTVALDAHRPAGLHL